MTDFFKLVRGEDVRCIVRIKPATNFQKEDVRINNSNIILTDANNRILEEFEVPEAYGGETGLQQIYENGLAQYLGPFIRGLNINFLAYGSTGAGKTQLIEGNKKEFGLVMLFASSLFALLDAKRSHAYNDATTQISNYVYEVQIQQVEIIDEQITDLLASKNTQSEDLMIIDDMWMGPTIEGATWETVQNDQQIGDHISRGLKKRNNTSNEFGKLSSKASAIYQIRLTQTSILKETNEPLVLKSVMNFFDLPGSEILVDDPETVRIKQGSTLNKVIIAVTQLIKDLGTRSTDFIMYDTSTVTKLNKECLGGNALSIVIFCLQHGDHKGSSLVLQTYKNCSKIQNFPIINDGKSLAVMRKFRLESHTGAKSGTDKSSKNIPVQEGVNKLKLLEMERVQNENQQQIMTLAEDRQKTGARLADLRQKYMDLVKLKTELQQDLIKSEEDKLEVSKALVELEMENTRLIDIIQNEKYNQNNKLLGEDKDLLTANVREEKALKTIQDLQERLKEVIDEKREFELEFMVLKKNYMSVHQELEGERLKQENYGLQLINLSNENKVLLQELNDAFKKTGSQSEEGQRLVDMIEKLERDVREKDESLLFCRADIERLKTELMRYDIQGTQARIDIDKKTLEIEKSIFNDGRQQFNDIIYSNKQSVEEIDRNRDDKMLWESQKMELSHKIKSLQRRINDDQERVKDLERIIQEVSADNLKMQIQQDEMRSIYRNKLIQFTTDTVKGKSPEIAAREELNKDFQDKEYKLQDERDILKKVGNQYKQDIRALRSYARNLRYLAEDWAPLGGQLPDILHSEPPFMVNENYHINTPQQDQTNEIERLKSRNKRLEEEVRIQFEKLSTKTDNQDMNTRLVGELALLKRPQSSNQEFEVLRRERNDLQEENRKLVAFLKDTKKWDILVSHKENERLMRMLKEYELGNVGPVSGDTRGLAQKVGFYEKAVKALEKEKTEYMVRTTMAEEQLNVIQTNLSRITHEYQKKIHELKKQLQLRQ